MRTSSTTRDEASWPYASLFFFGFFGTKEPAGRRLAWRTTWALALFFVGILLASAGHPAAAAAGAAAMPASVLLLAWAYARYLRELDELGRMIQLQAFAASYGAAMVIVVALIAIAMATSGGAPGWEPLTTPFWVVFAEPFRGLALVVLARRYR